MFNGAFFPPGLLCVVEKCSEDTIIEHKKPPPDDFLIIPSLDHNRLFPFYFCRLFHCHSTLDPIATILTEATPGFSAAVT